MASHLQAIAIFHPKKHSRSVHHRYFLHTLFLMLTATLTPVILLGLLVSSLMSENLRASAADSNTNILSQFQASMENIISEVNYMNIGISVNSDVYHLLKKTLTDADYSASVNKVQPVVNSYLIPLIATKNYIDSMYIYMDNPYDRFVSVPEGLRWLTQYRDTSWLEGYLAERNSGTSIWCRPRSYRKYSFLQEDTHVISIYQKFYYGNGVSIINLSADYFEKELQQLNLSSGQIVLAVNEKNEVLFSSTAPDTSALIPLLSTLPLSQDRYTGTENFLGERCYVVQLYSRQGNIRYLSITPYASLYESVYQFYHYILLFAVLITLLCIAISYLLSRQFYQNISQIIDLFAAAERGESLSDRKPPQNLYGLLMQNITQTFVQQNSLKMRLKENEYQNKILELQSLQTQISPHFLFNTLKSIYWMSFQLTESNNEVCQVIENMTDILDYSLTRHDTLVSLEAELHNTDNYIELQRIRHNYQFTVDWDFPAALLSCRTIRLLLQPLVENCIVHAFTWESDENIIRIRIREKNGVITIKIIDNGIGIPSEKLQKLRLRLNSGTNAGHIGIFNSNRRLSLTFGSDYGLHIQSKSGMGTIITLRFPKI